jgi:hypothetical protein
MHLSRSSFWPHPALGVLLGTLKRAKQDGWLAGDETSSHWLVLL